MPERFLFMKNYNKINNKKDNNNVVNSSTSSVSLASSANQNNDIIISCKINADSQLYKDFQKFLKENKNVKKSVFIRNALQNELNRYFIKCKEERKNNNDFDVADRFILNDFNNNSADAKEKKVKEKKVIEEENKELNLQEIKRKVKIERKLIELENRIELIENCLF